MAKKPTTRAKNCYCHTCKKAFHYLGITKHRAAHRSRFEDCTITFTHGDTWTYKFSNNKKKNEQSSRN